MIKTILLSSLIIIAIIVVTQEQQAKAAFPTKQQKEDQDLLNSHFLAFIVGCKFELGLSTEYGGHPLTTDEAMNCTKSYKTFKERTGGSDSDVIGLIVDRLGNANEKTNSSCTPPTGIGMSNESQRKWIELSRQGGSC